MKNLIVVAANGPQPQPDRAAIEALFLSLSLRAMFSPCILAEGIQFI